MVAMERIGFRGLPKETLEQLKPRLKKLHLPSLKVVLVTDHQGQRERARYRVFLVGGKHALLTEDAFGPAYGEEGVRALAQLIETLRKGGAFNFKEAVLPPDVYSTLDELDPHALRERLLANANPADPTLFAA